MAKQDSASGARKMFQDVKDQIRSIAVHPLRSSEWRTVVESLGKLATVVETEQATAISNTRAGTGTDTLWDPKGDEWTLRHILSEGKLNLILRLLDEYLRTELTTAVQAWEAIAVGDLTAAIAALSLQGPPTGEGEPANAAASDRLFETSCATLVCAGWRHKEGLQTTDMGTVASVLRHACGQCLSAQHAGARQGVAILACRLLAALGDAVAAVGEEKVVREFGRQGLFCLFPSFFAACACGGVGLTAVGVAGKDSGLSPSAGGSSAAAEAIEPPLLAGARGACKLMTGEEFAVLRQVLLSGADKGVGVPVADRVLQEVTTAPTAAQTDGKAAAGAVQLVTGLDSHTAACASVSKGPAAVALGVIGDQAVKRKLRPLLDYCDAVARATKR